MKLRVAVAILALAASGSPAHAALNSKERVAAFARLPNWSGLWEQFALQVVRDENDAQERRIWAEARKGSRPPYNAEWEAKFQKTVEDLVSGKVADAPTCTFGFPTLMVGSPLMFQAIVTPEETTLIFSQRETRHIYTDGRPLPSEDDRWPSPWGHSIGKWEGDTLVVTTVGAESKGILTAVNAINAWQPLSPEARFVERIRMVNPNTLENEMTFEDPVAATRPWKYTFRYHRVPNMNAIVDQDCEGNERNPVVDGQFTMTPHQ